MCSSDLDRIVFDHAVGLHGVRRQITKKIVVKGDWLIGFQRAQDRLLSRIHHRIHLIGDRDLDVLVQKEREKQSQKDQHDQYDHQHLLGQ